MSSPILVRRRRALLRVWGREPVKMLHGLATADIEAVSPEQGAYTTFLTVKGKLVADARIFAHPAADELLLETDPAAVESLVAHLKKFIPPLFARFENVSDAWIVQGVYGDGASGVAAAAMEALGLGGDTGDVGDSGDLSESAPDEAVPLRSADPPALPVRTRLAGGDGWEILAPAPLADDLVAALREAGGTPAGDSDLERLRVEAGRPRWGAELTDSVIPLEAGLLDRAISQSKGCYTGQEVIVRILHRGHVNRHLRRLRADDAAAEALAPGAELFEPGNERARGSVTSAVPSNGGIVAMGYVRREIEPPASLRAGSPDGPEVHVETLTPDT